MDDIDYTQKILNFQNLTDNYNEEEALNFLQENDWDEKKAANKYLSRKRGNQNSNVDYQDRLLQNSMYEQSSTRRTPPQRQPVVQQDNSNDSYFSYITRPLSYIKSLFCSRREDEFETEVSLDDLALKEFPGRIESLKDFNQKVKDFVGIMILYSSNDIKNIEQLIKDLKKEENKYLDDIIQENYRVFMINTKIPEGQKMYKKLTGSNFTPNKPTEMIFLINASKTDLNFDKTHVIDKIVGNGTDLIKFKDYLLKHIEAKDLAYKTQNMIRDGSTKSGSFKNNSNEGEKKNLLNNKFDSNDGLSSVDPNMLTQAELIEYQKKQLEKLELEENRKKQEEEEKRKQILKEQQEKEEKERQAQKLKEEKAKSLPDEPEKSADTTTIIFRYPHSEQRKERRFLKTDKVQLLYDFVHSLGTEMFEESNEFDLIQPFPMKKYNDMDKTLEEEKLYPNAVLQIREN